LKVGILVVYRIPNIGGLDNISTNTNFITKIREILLAGRTMSGYMDVTTV
jgi:hypothetical protein